MKEKVKVDELVIECDESKLNDREYGELLSAYNEYILLKE